MTKTFCDRCEELLNASGSYSGAIELFSEIIGRRQITWNVEIKIQLPKLQNSTSVLLCKGCRDELLNLMMAKLNIEPAILSEGNKEK